MSTLTLRLPELQGDSGQRLPTSLIYGFSSAPGGSVQLINIQRRGGDYVGVPKRGAATIMQNLQSRVKVFTLDAGRGGFMSMLNHALKGGNSYPVLEAVLGTVAGVASAGAGLIFAATTLGINLQRRSSDVLARLGDEIWHVEEIGHVVEGGMFSGDARVPVHISSYLLVDPYRSRGDAAQKGWLLHESRTRVALD